MDPAAYEAPADVWAWDRDEGWTDRGHVLRWAAHEVVHHENDIRWASPDHPLPPIKDFVGAGASYVTSAHNPDPQEFLDPKEFLDP